MTIQAQIRHVREKGRITSTQVAWMLLAIITSFTGTTVPRLLIEAAGQDAWLSVLLALAADLALALVYAHMGLRFPGETMVEYTSTVLGRWLGKPLGFMFPLFFFLVGALQLRAVGDLIAAVFLRGTPGGLIAFATVATAAYAARHGLEVTARAAEVLGPLFIISAGAIAILVSPLVKLERLQPILEKGTDMALGGAPITLSFMAVCIMMGMFQAYQDQPQRAWQAKAAAVTMGSLVLIGVVVHAVTVLGADIAGRSNYPDLEVVRMISVADFLERVEAIWVMISVGSSILGLAILLWASSLGIAQTFGLREYKPLVLPLAGLMLPLSLMLFESPDERYVFVRSIFPIYALLVEGGLEVLVWLAALVLGRRGIAGRSRVEG